MNINMIRSGKIFVLLFALISVGCEHVSVNEDDGCNTVFVESDFPAATVSFQNDIVPILGNYSCSSGFCHGNEDSPPSNFLVLDAVSILGPGNEAAQLETCNVIRGNPDDSYLVQKLLGTAQIGERMPMGGDAIDTADLNTIRQWIIEGARNN